VFWSSAKIAKKRFLKRVPEKYELNDLVYKWTCPCNSTYIGQTKRRAGIRWCEHINSNQTNKSDPSTIFAHMSSCATLDQQYQNYISDPSTKNFTSSHRTKSAKSEYALKYFHSKNPPKIRRKLSKNDFALKYFDVLRTNLTNEYDRKKVESFLILLHKPSLNKQIDFKHFKTF